MFEDNIESPFDSHGIEICSDFGGIENRNHITETEFNYLSEILPFNNSELLVNRIDELCGSQPPKAIDTNAEVSALINSVKDDINPIYLEAPDDSIQIAESVEAIRNIEGLDYNTWKCLDVSERADALQTLENRIAAISHRPACHLNVAKIDEGVCGYYDPNTKQIFFNDKYLQQDSFAAYKENLDTIVHEGRHAYQDYNMTERMVHPREGEIDNWMYNEYGLGYLDARDFGFELYRSQPMEADAIAFASDVIKQYLRG